jgi:hypothetical protein
MTLLTLFTAPKPFTDPHIAIIQRNALRSWVALGGEVEVLAVGDEAGMAETAADAGVRHLPDVRRNAWGTPLISSIFELAEDNSRSPFLCYANADIILLPDVLAAARSVSQLAGLFLLIGQRWDLDLREALDFSAGWERQLREEIRARAKLHPPAGSDYFLFRRGSFKDIPNFAVGRAGWDNWMISHAVKEGWPVIDATKAVTAVHQSHDYNHLPGGSPHYNAEESELNRVLAGGKVNMYLVTDANRRLVNGEIETVNPGFAGLLRRVELWLTPAQARPGGVRWFFARYLRRLRRKLTQPTRS